MESPSLEGFHSRLHVEPGARVSGGIGSAGEAVGLDGLCLFQPRWFRDSVLFCLRAAAPAPLRGLRAEPWASPVFANTCNKRDVGGHLGAVVFLWLVVKCS